MQLTILLFSSTSILFPNTTYTPKKLAYVLPFPTNRCCDIRRETNLDLSARLGSGTRPATNPGYRMTLHYSHRRRERNSQRLDRKLHREIGIALGRLCPIAVITEPRISKILPEITHNLSGGIYGPPGFSYLHRNQPIVDKNFLRQKICSDRGLVACAEFFVDLSIHPSAQALPRDTG